MTPEREQEIRAQHARDGGRMSLSKTNTHRDRGVLLDEIDRLRALPVLRTCGECGSCCVVGDHPVYVCRRDDPPYRRTDPAHEPPTWCPLRGGAS